MSCDNGSGVSKADSPINGETSEETFLRQGDKREASPQPGPSTEKKQRKSEPLDPEELPDELSNLDMLTTLETIFLNWK